MADTIPEEDDEPESHADRLFAMLRLWGLAEVLLDMCLMHVMSHHETRSPLPPYPATLERKLGYLMEAVKMIHPTLADATEPAATVRARFNSEKKLRNDIVHGAPLKFENDGTVHFFLLQRRKGHLPTYTLRVVRPKDWDRLTEVSAHLFFETLVLFFAVHPGAGLLDEPEEVRRERAIRGLADLPASKALRDLLKELFASRP